MSWEDLPDWVKRRWRRTPFPTGGFFEDIDTMIEAMFKEAQDSIPQELYKEEALPDESIIKRTGPIVYGYSMSIGPDGKPVIREFGNLKPSKKPSAFGSHKPGLEVKAEREPLVDTIKEDNTIKVVAEVPGVEKEDIDLELAENSLMISVNTETRKYSKVIPLSSQIDSEKVKASYRNGVLEVVLTRKELKPKGQRIDIE